MPSMYPTSLLVSVLGLHQSEKEDPAEDADERTGVDLDENTQYGKVESNRSEAKGKLDPYPQENPLQDLPGECTNQKSQAEKTQECGAVFTAQFHGSQMNMTRSALSVKAEAWGSRKPDVGRPGCRENILTVPAAETPPVSSVPAGLLLHDRSFTTAAGMD